jgi:hypothetical protein
MKNSPPHFLGGLAHAAPPFVGFDRFVGAGLHARRFAQKAKIRGRFPRKERAKRAAT